MLNRLLKPPTKLTQNKNDTDTGFINLQNEFNKVNDMATEKKKKKKQKKIEDTIESVIVDDNNLFSTFDNFWWKDDMFNRKDNMFNDTDSVAMVDASKNILNDISDNILNNLQPVNNRTEQEVADD